MRTVTPTQLRDPEVLARAGYEPLTVFDAKRETELVIGSREAWETRRELLDVYASVLANAVVELPDDRPSVAALGPLGFAASWTLNERLWLLRQVAEAFATSVQQRSTAPIAQFIGFIAQAGAETATPAALTGPIDVDLPPTLAGRLRPRAA